MKRILLEKLLLRRGPQGKNPVTAARAVARRRAACPAPVLAFALMLVVTLAGASGLQADDGASVSSSASASAGAGQILICLRQQNRLGGYGPERCLAAASAATGYGTDGFGPASYFVGDHGGPLQAAAVRRLRNSFARPEFAAFDLEKTTRLHAPIAIWLLSYNIRELASTGPAHADYWTAMRLHGYQSIGLTALDPGIERSPTGLKAFGLRISLPY